MKRILFLSTLLFAAMQVMAANVDVATAQMSALRYLQASAHVGRHSAPARLTDVQLVRSEPSTTISGQPVYYIFNTSDSYVIVSGDDRARAVLAHGDRPLDVNNIPCNMKLWLTGYKQQIEYLQAHPDLVVDNNPSLRASMSGYESVEPLLTAEWDQGYPYNLECPTAGELSCVTGCGATALAMIFHHWKYPTEPTPSIPAYTTQSRNLFLEALPSTTFDWDNMLDHYYGGFSDVQAHAVAKLMRYLGQSERMDYAPDGSGTGSYDIVNTVKRFNYDQDVRLVSKENWWSGEYYSDEEWGAIIQDEIANQRPVLMCAYSPTWSGHAFDIDGYDADEDTYHINWGWSGSGNAFYALNAFKGGGELFNVGQQVIIGIEPPATVPTIKAWSTNVSAKAYVDSTKYSSFSVKGALLTSDVDLTLNDESGFFSISTEHISLDALQQQQGARVNVTYHPTAMGLHHATVVLSSEGAEDKVINLYGTCILETYDPVMMDADNVTESSFDAHWQDATPSHNVVSYNLEVAPVPFYELRMHEAFDKTEYSGISTTDCSSKLDEITTIPGWTGSKLFRSNNDLILGTTKAKGWIETPALDMYGNNGMITIKVVAKSTGSDSGSPLKISCGENDTTLVLSNEEDETYCVLLPCPATDDAKVKLSSATGKRVVLCQIDIFAGDDYNPVDLSKAIYFEGITESSYTVNNLIPGYYSTRIQTLYTDNVLSPWSNRMRVLINWKRGDVNHDGEINIADVNEILDIIFDGYASPCAMSLTDVNGDGEINIADINAIIYSMMAE